MEVQQKRVLFFFIKIAQEHSLLNTDWLKNKQTKEVNPLKETLHTLYPDCKSGCRVSDALAVSGVDGSALGSEKKRVSQHPELTTGQRYLLTIQILSQHH